MISTALFPLSISDVYTLLAEALVAGAVAGAALCWLARLFKGGEK